MIRSWFLVKNHGYPLSYAMKMVWQEMKDFRIELTKPNLKTQFQGCSDKITDEVYKLFYYGENSTKYKGD